ncbi:Uncharacterised protein [Serratia odorifera]|uniref:Uncharacterized protein n=1 Tax=Serratia odorifera TaxID=618 RepID=A0A3S4DAT1_SEROD|nr:Uncharacterised protein [Serratia odorifera]
MLSDRLANIQRLHVAAIVRPHDPFTGCGLKQHRQDSAPHYPPLPTSPPHWAQAHPWRRSRPGFKAQWEPPPRAIQADQFFILIAHYFSPYRSSTVRSSQIDHAALHLGDPRCRRPPSCRHPTVTRGALMPTSAVPSTVTLGPEIAALPRAFTSMLMPSMSTASFPCTVTRPLPVTFVCTADRSADSG